MAKFRIIILAAGKGTRMNANLPKTLIPVGGKPILQHLIESVKASSINSIPIIVIGHEREQLCARFDEDDCEYVVQEEQLGTGHAVMVCQEAVGDADSVVVLYGDHPFVSAETLDKLRELHERSGNVMTVMTTTVPNFDGWYNAFSHWGRILRDNEGGLLGIRQFKDAGEDERGIKEVDPALYCFQTEWLWENITRIRNLNAQKEYYLTDLLGLAVEQGHQIESLSVPPEEALGINTPEELATAEEIYKRTHG